MPQSGDMLNVSLGLSELCFDKKEFMKANFSVDNFLHEHRNNVSLENMRNDLGIYLEVLQSSMIELINADYADFVNLSANLVGLDESLESIRATLQRLGDDILNIKFILDDNLIEIRKYLDEKKVLRTYKRFLKCLIKVDKSIQKLKRLLASLNDDLDPALLERAAVEFIKLKFNSRFGCNNAEIVQRNDVQNLHKDLLLKLKTYFLNSLKVNTDDLERCLRIYATLDERNIAEEVFRNEITDNYMRNVISEKLLQSSPHGLANIYNNVLDFIPLHMKELLLLTLHSEKLKGFNFLINSFWRDVEEKLETNLSSIFAPGNPDSFFRKYKATQEFLLKIENTLGDAKLINEFHNSEHFKSFQARWNLPVYFQIRFQEIAGSLENACNQSILLDISEKGATSPTKTAYTCIMNCWNTGVYIDKLFPRFWKLTLQIISRIHRWISEALDNLKSNSTDFDKIPILISLHCDVLDFKNQLPTILQIVQNNLPKEITPHSTVLEKCMEETSGQIDFQLNAIEKLLSEETILKSSIHIRQVSDIPRLYRKTNRDIPNKHCAYIEQMLEPIMHFHNSYSQRIGEDKAKQIIHQAFSSITKKYHSAVSGVLTSVQKTEESLRRLKNLRDKSMSNTSTTSDRCTLSDDDKIRLQLQVDAIFWVDEIEKLNIQRTEVDKLTDLINLVEDVTKIKITNK